MEIRKLTEADKDVQAFLTRTLKIAAAQYYNTGTSAMTDYEFDRQLARLKDLEAEHGFDLVIHLTTYQIVRIPVHTGRMRPAVRTGNSPPVHPRAYGVDENVTPRKFQQPDSSPCIRGRFAGILFTKSTVRLIPAHAGRMESTVSLILMCWTHPRAYGADSPTTVHPVPSMGSSPCIRGRH